MYFAHFRWHCGISQWHQRVAVISIVHETWLNPCSGVQLWDQWPSIYQRVLPSHNDIYSRWLKFGKTITYPLVRRNLGLLHARRIVGRMSSQYLSLFKLMVLLLGIMFLSDRHLRCVRSWILVWSCTTWSLRVSLTSLVDDYSYDS
jgi:hypothetical protein